MSVFVSKLKPDFQDVWGRDGVFKSLFYPSGNLGDEEFKEKPENLLTLTTLMSERTDLHSESPSCQPRCKLTSYSQSHFNRSAAGSFWWQVCQLTVKNGPKEKQSEQLSENNTHTPHPQLRGSSQSRCSDPKLNSRPAPNPTHQSQAARGFVTKRCGPLKHPVNQFFKKQTPDWLFMSCNTVKIWFLDFGTGIRSKQNVWWQKLDLLRFFLNVNFILKNKNYPKSLKPWGRSGWQANVRIAHPITTSSVTE